MINSIAIQEFEITLSGVAQSLLFTRVDHLGRLAEVGAGAGLHLDKDQNVPMPANQVNFPAGNAVVAQKHPVSLAAQEGRRHALTVGARFRRRRQPGRERSLGPV